MEIIGLIAAVLFGIILAMFRERKFREKLKRFKLYQDDLSKINVRLSEVVRPKGKVSNDSNLEVQGLKKRFDTIAITKLLKEYDIESDSKAYEDSKFLTSAYRLSVNRCSVNNQKKKNDSYPRNHFLESNETYA